VSFADGVVGAFTHLSLLLLSLRLFPPVTTPDTKKEPAGVVNVAIDTPHKVRPTDSKKESSKMFMEPPQWGATAAIAGLPHPFAFNIALKEQKARAVFKFLSNLCPNVKRASPWWVAQKSAAVNT
jgi:hypothetical protein